MIVVFVDPNVWPHCGRCGRNKEKISFGPFVCPDDGCEAEQVVEQIFAKAEADRNAEAEEEES